MEFLNIVLFLSIDTLDDFSEGFWYGVVVTLTLSFIVFVFGRYWKKVMAIFKPTRVPATNPGPSPIQKMMGCVVSLIIVVILVLVTAYLLQFIFI